VPLVFGAEWWRPHSHVTALTPVASGRAIVNGTFTHPSPVAALVYRGDAGRGPITELVERLDGRALFGRPLDGLDAATFNAHARRLGVSIVVALDEDLPNLPALVDNPTFGSLQREPPFVVWMGPPAALPQPVAPGRWRASVESAAAGWQPAGVAFYPLWHASTAGAPLETRRGRSGDLEVRVPAGTTTLELTYRAGLVEWAGVTLSAIGVVAWLVSVWPLAARCRPAGPES
jgi:hypothetical protein